MGEYVKRDDALCALEQINPVDYGAMWDYEAHHYAGECLRDCKEAIDSIPAADVAPVMYARWIRPHWKNSNYCCDCSECGGEAMHRDYQWDKNGIYPICPNCGAKMDGGDGDAVD